MRREDLPDLVAFAAVANERSFTRAASRLGMSQPALSHAIRALEKRLDLRLLARTTRSVAPTEAGQRLLETLQPALDAIDSQLQSLETMRHGLAGTVRITAVRHAGTSIVLPALRQFREQYPGIKIELSLDDAFTDIVAGGFDAGIRLGDHVEKDMIAQAIGPDVRAAVVASPDYFERFPVPKSPRDLDDQDCIGYRLAGSGEPYRWQFARAGRPVTVSVAGSLMVNDGDALVRATLEGQGLAFTFEHYVLDHIAAGRLVRVLEPWCPSQPGYRLYYASRRKSPALAAFIAALRI